MKEYKGDNKTMLFYVYKTLNGLYAEEKICKIYNVGNSDDKKVINGINVIKCTKEEIDYIVEKTYNQIIRLTPHYISSYELKLETTYIVYVDKKDNDALYIKEDLCEKYNITPISKRSVNKITYCKVTNDDLNIIEEKSKTDNPILKRKYINTEFTDTIKKPKNILFTYYRNIITNKLYINRTILELTRNYNIEIEGTPEILNNKNCYTITPEELKEFEEKSISEGIEININPNNIDKDHYKIETILVYKDCNTNKLYIEKNKSKNNNPNNIKILLNKEFYEISQIELKDNNKKYIIVDIYPYNKPTEYSFIVCSCNNETFIPQKTIEKFNIQTEYKKIIRVNHELYEKVDEETLNNLLNNKRDDLIIKPIYKKIVPMNK